MQPDAELQEGLDYYIENGLFVFTGTFLLRRGYCCESGCRNCPYQDSELTGSLNNEKARFHGPPPDESSL